MIEFIIGTIFGGCVALIAICLTAEDTDDDEE